MMKKCLLLPNIHAKNNSDRRIILKKSTFLTDKKTYYNIIYNTCIYCYTVYLFIYVIIFVIPEFE